MNMGTPNLICVVLIQGGLKLHILVDPNNLHFTTLNKKYDYFVVNIRDQGIKTPLTINSMSLTWNDGNHKVYSLLVVYTGKVTSSRGVST